MSRGGKRPGAGMPKGHKSKKTLDVLQAREYIRKRVTEELGPIMDVAIEQAKKGDAMTRRDLFDRAYNKAIQPISGDSESDPIKIDVNITPALKKAYGK
jgi:hypothetical protein